MRRTNHLLLTTLLVVAHGSTALAQSGPADAQSIRPAVMLMVDTSGSMERIPDDGTNPNCDSCVPTCTGDTLVDRNNKTRWALTVEALTGTIQNYSCRSVDRSTLPPDSNGAPQYDYGYYLPHIDFTSSLTQATDGILDSFATRVKFGLMTFDGVGTTQGGDTLVPYHTWFDDTAFRTAAYGAPGMYSYGDVGRLAFPGCLVDYGINAGARGEGTFPGALISVPLSDAIDDSLAANSRIQQSLLDVRPFGGTPIAGMLDDLRFYLETNGNVNRTGDELFACRSRKAILITDGAPDAMFRDSRFRCGIEEPTTGGSGRVVNASCTAPNTHPGGSFVDPGCSCPYKRPDLIASQLTAGTKETRLLSDLIVVAYNVHDTAALRGLEDIAVAAQNQGEPADYVNYKHVVQADGAGQLRQELDTLLNATQPGVTSRSVPISVTVGDPVVSGNSKRFDIIAGFQVGQNTADRWQGLLYRGRAVCQGTSPSNEPYSTAAGDVFHESLTAQTAAGRRVMLTATPSTYGPVDGTLRNVNYRPAPLSSTVSPFDHSRDYDGTPLAANWITANVLRPDGSNFTASIIDSTPIVSQGRVTTSLNLPDVNNPNFVNTSMLDSQYFGDATRDNVPGRPEDRAAVLDFVMGRGRNNALGDIYHSQPIVMIPINTANASQLNSIDAKYTGWLRTMLSNGAGSHYQDGRPGVVFVGTNDGLLHAFNLDDWRNGGGTVPGGYEFWSFAPPALFGKMASMLDSHQVGFDGSPQVKDVVLQRRANSEPIFRTILVSAVSGAHAFVALDVTLPEQPVFLWQFSAPDVGNTIGNPALTQINVNWNREGDQIRAVAILPAGEGVACATGGAYRPIAGQTRAEFPTGNNRDVRCWQRRGRALYVVDVATGQVIQEFGPEHFPSPLTGSVVVDSPGVTPSSAAYFFDHDGILWRLSMLHSDPQSWKVSPVYDMYADPATPTTTPAPATYSVGRRPLYAPSITRDKQGNIVLLAGTGDPDSPRDTARHRVISLKEKRGRNVNDEISAEMELLWRIDLNQNEAVTGPLSVFQEAVYFGTFEAGANDKCSLGVSRLWGAYSQEADTNTIPPAPKPHLTGRNASPADPYILSEDYNTNSLILGVTITQQPVCQSSSRIYNAVTQQYVSQAPPGGGGYQLSAVMAGGSSGGTTRTGDVGRGAVLQMSPQNLRTVHSSKVTSWASMFE